MAEKTRIRIDKDLAEIVPGYLENRRKDLVTIETALSAGDYATITTIGHRIRGTGSGYGFDWLSIVGATLETAGKAADIAVIQKSLADIRDYLDRIEVFYE